VICQESHAGHRRRLGFGEILISVAIAGDAMSAIQRGTMSAQSIAIRREAGETRHAIRDENLSIFLLEHIHGPTKTVPGRQPYSVAAKNLNAIVSRSHTITRSSWSMRSE
jgi:hypothetical protein